MNSIIEIYIIKRYGLNEDTADKLRKITFKNPITKRSNTMLTALADPENPYHNKAKRIAATYKISQKNTVKKQKKDDIDEKQIHKIMNVFDANSEDKDNVKSILKERDPNKFTQEFRKRINPETPDEDIKTIYSLWNGDEATVKEICKRNNFDNEVELAKTLVDKVDKKIKSKKRRKDTSSTELPQDYNDYKPDRRYKNVPEETSDDLPDDSSNIPDNDWAFSFEDNNDDDDRFQQSYTGAFYDPEESNNNNKENSDLIWDMINNDAKTKGSGFKWGRVIAISLAFILLGGFAKKISNIISGKKKDEEEWRGY